MDEFESYLPRTRPEASAGGWHWTDEEFAGEYPVIFALMARARMDDKERVGASVTLFCDTGELKCVISDRQTGQALFLTLDAAKGLWEQLEAFCRAHPNSWRAKKEQDAPKRRY